MKKTLLAGALMVSLILSIGTASALLEDPDKITDWWEIYELLIGTEKSTTYTPTANQTIQGTWTGGNITSLSNLQEGGRYATYNVTEAAGADPMTIIINFSAVNSFDTLIYRTMYTGGAGHEIAVGLYDYDDAEWEEEYGEITDMDDFANGIQPVLDPSKHVSGTGEVAVRFRHVNNGNPAHTILIDYVALVEGTTALTTVTHDGLSGRNDPGNHPWAVAKAGDVMTGDLNLSDDSFTSNFLNLTADGRIETSGNVGIRTQTLGNRALNIVFSPTDGSVINYGTFLNTNFGDGGTANTLSRQIGWASVASTDVTFANNITTLGALIAIEAYAEHIGSGWVFDARVLNIDYENEGSGTTVNAKGINIERFQAEGGKFYNAYGIYINDIDVGSKTNYAIYTEGGNISFGDHVAIAGDLIVGDITAGVGNFDGGAGSGFSTTTTGRVIGGFSSSSADYARMVINTINNNKDAQVSFLDQSTTRWSIGNDGTDNSFNIEVGAGVFSTPSLKITTGHDITGLTTITATTNLVSGANVTVGFANTKSWDYHVVCYLPGGTLGHCTDHPGISGKCTCASNDESP